MDFAFPLPRALRTGDRIVKLDTASLGALRAKGGREQSSEDALNMNTIINVMGERSAEAQKLPQVITTASRLVANDHRMYTLHEYDPRAKSTCRVIGFIKVGEKKLFLYDTAGKMHEVTPTCVLDFYVHESCQRCGFGKELFDHMVAAEGLEPHELAIDKPSPKFSAFLGKHFNLHDVVRQTNNYMVFAAFFRGGPPRKGAGATSGAARSAQGSRSHSRQSASSSKRSDLGVADRKPLNPNSLPTRQTAPAPTSRQPPRSTPRISSISFG